MKNTVCKTILVFLLIVTVYRYVNSYYETLSKWSLTLTLSTVLFSSIIFLLLKNENQQELKGNYYQISTIFVIGYIIVHFFEYLAFVIGEHTSIIDIEFVDPSYVNGAALVSCACLISFYIGSLFVKSGFSDKVKNRTVSSGNLLEYIMIVSIIVFYVSAGDAYFSGGYGEAMNETGMSLFAELSQTIIVGAIVARSAIIVYNNKHTTFITYTRQFSLLYYISIFTYCYLVLISGDRGPILQCAICYVTPYFFVGKRKLKAKYAVAFLCFGALLFSLLGTVRSMEGSLNMDKVVEAQKFRNERYADDNIIFTSTAELSNVVRAYHVIYYFSETKYIVYGAGFINQFLGVIPGLRFLVYPLLGINDTEITTARLSTVLLKQDHGMGSTCVADTYFNFGFYGSVIVFFFVGVLFRKMDISAYKNLNRQNPFVVCATICYMMFAIYIGRGYLSSPINILAYSWILFVLNERITRKKINH